MQVIHSIRTAAVVAAVMATLGAGAMASAQPRWGGPGHGMRDGFALGQLNLTDDQQEQVRTVMEQHKAERQAVFERLREAHRAQAEAIDAVPVNEAAIRARTEELAKAETDAALLRARVHAEVYNLLTPEQQEKAKTLRAERQQRHQQRKSQPPASQPKQ